MLLLKQTEADSGEDTMPLKIGELWKPSPPTLSSPNNNIQRDSNAWKIIILNLYTCRSQCKPVSIDLRDRDEVKLFVLIESLVEKMQC